MIGVAESKLIDLRARLRDMGRVAVAFSGGVDSAFVLAVALDVLGREHVLAVTGRSASLKNTELEDAICLADKLGAEHIIIDTNEFDDPRYLSNPTDRCYFCKTTLYAAMRPLIDGRGLYVIVNGTNADDLSDYRPGLKAAEEHGVRSPLAEAGLTKPEIRELSRRMGLSVHDKPAAPCLSSRVPYGELITRDKLRAIEDGERFLASLGFRECRVRHHGAIARIEVPPGDLPRILAEPTRDAIDHALRDLGFTYVTVDLRGLRSGSLNDVIQVGLPDRFRADSTLASR